MWDGNRRRRVRRASGNVVVYDMTTDEFDDEIGDDESDIAGGVPFDDVFDDEDELDDEDTRGSGPAYDSGKKLNARGIKYPRSTPAGMKALRSYTLKRWGGKNMGILANPPRSFRGSSSSPSLHNWGMAYDWRFANPGPGRAAADEAMEFLIEHASDLGVQAIHDYSGGRYWKNHAGWKKGTTSSTTGMGQSWAEWLHIERTWAGANDERTIETVLRGGGHSVPTSSASSTPGETSSTIELPDPEIVKGDTGANVARLQDFLRKFGYATFTRSDGIFGAKTFESVQAAQTSFIAKSWYSGKVDGEYGPKSAAAARQAVAAQK